MNQEITGDVEMPIDESSPMEQDIRSQETAEMTPVVETFIPAPAQIQMSTSSPTPVEVSTLNPIPEPVLAETSAPAVSSPSDPLPQYVPQAYQDEIRKKKKVCVCIK